MPQKKDKCTANCSRCSYNSYKPLQTIMWLTELSNYLIDNRNYNEINPFKVSAAIADKTVFFCKSAIN